MVSTKVNTKENTMVSTKVNTKENNTMGSTRRDLWIRSRTRSMVMAMTRVRKRRRRTRRRRSMDMTIMVIAAAVTVIRSYMLSLGDLGEKGSNGRPDGRAYSHHTVLLFPVWRFDA
ncbi:hypothetical protein HKD37_17G048234 [Glycine soja]